MKKIYPIILAGGSGTRLWPLSRKSFPKQFSNLIGEHTLFQQTALRLRSSEFVKFSDHIVLTNSDFRFIINEQLNSVGIKPGSILIEPEAKNTGPAILSACLHIIKTDPNAILLVAPSDHIIRDVSEFHRTVFTGLRHVECDKIVTFGIPPLGPETGYGYLELECEKLDDKGSAGVVRFVEKPNSERVKVMLREDNYLWNSGIFLFKASKMIAAFDMHAPDQLALAKEAVDLAVEDLSFLRLNSRPWDQLKSISIDYAIMENAKNLVAVPCHYSWSDLGGWKAVWEEADKDEAGNGLSEGSYAVDCTNTLLRAESETQKIVGLGLDHVVAIAMSDAVLIASTERSQDVKKVVEILKTNNIMQSEKFPKDHRPWGYFESVLLDKSCQVKLINVNPGGALSLQSHKYRSEHWVVVEGSGRVTVDEKVQTISSGQSVYVPLGAKHRLENLSEVPLVVIEVQTGTYLGEDDITRYEDVYKRTSDE